MSDETHHERELGGQLLAAVSRSFYLTLKALPKELREPISLAYLLARTADTIADTGSGELVPLTPSGENIDRLRETAQMMLNARYNMKLASGARRALAKERALVKERALAAIEAAGASEEALERF